MPTLSGGKGFPSGLAAAVLSDVQPGYSMIYIQLSEQLWISLHLT